VSAGAGIPEPGAGWRRADGAPAQQRESRRRGTGSKPGVSMVAEAEFTSYYGRPVLKAPTWKQPDVPAYLFLGGAAGTSAMLGTLAEVTDRPALAAVAHRVASAGALASVGFLVHDLGRPARFLHMLRVLKVTSPLSVGSWILAPFSALTTATAGAQLLGWFPRLRRVTGAVAAVLGGPMTTYTAVLIANTAVPSWHEPHRELPYLFAGSAAAGGGALCSVFTPVAEAAPARRMAIAGAAVELAVMQRVEHGHGLVSEPFRIGRAGLLLRLARTSTATGAGLLLVAGRRRWAAVAGGALVAAGSALTRFGVFDAGMTSARDPKYTVEPQRERARAREVARQQEDARR